MSDPVMSDPVWASLYDRLISEVIKRELYAIEMPRLHYCLPTREDETQMILRAFERTQREQETPFHFAETRERASAEWSRQLREKVAASSAQEAERERCRVVVDLDW